VVRVRVENLPPFHDQFFPAIGDHPSMEDIKELIANAPKRDQCLKRVLRREQAKVRL
jgi:hypothetical protein